MGIPNAIPSSVTGDALNAASLELTHARAIIRTVADLVATFEAVQEDQIEALMAAAASVERADTFVRAAAAQASRQASATVLERAGDTLDS